MSADFERKYESILSQERSLAKAVAYTLVQAKPMSVWEVTIPVVFILNYLNLKKTRELSAQNFLFTKKLALEAALDMTKNDKKRNDVLCRLEGKTKSVLAGHDKGIYSEDIRQRQVQEIDFLIDHYCKLLRAEGQDHHSLVRQAYENKSSYIDFLKGLQELEREVSLAAQQTFGTEKAAEVVARMEEITEKVRMAEAEKIFGTIADAE